MELSNQPGSWIFEAFRRGGVDADRLTKEFPLLTDHALSNLADLSTDEVSQLLNKCAAMTGDENFGLHMIEYLETHATGAYGYLLLNTSTVKQLFQLAERYYPTFYRGGELKISLCKQHGLLKYQTTQPSSICSRHLTEWTLGFFVSFIRTRFNPDWSPAQVSFTHRQPDDIEELEQLFQSNLLFQQPTNSFTFNREILDSTAIASDPQLQQVIVDHLEGLLRQVVNTRSFEARVRLSILEKLGQQGLSAEAVAKEMNISVSTLKRRLQGLKINFRSLRDEIVRDFSQRALLKTDANISEIALKVGYSELSAFTRAFSRICGMTPSEFRQGTLYNIGNQR